MSLYENMQRRYGYTELNVARWNDPRGSVHPARGGPRTPLIAPDVATKPFSSGYKVTYRRPPPPPTDDEGSDDDEVDQVELPSGAVAGSEPTSGNEPPIVPLETVSAQIAPGNPHNDAVAAGEGVGNDNVATAPEDKSEPALSESEQEPLILTQDHFVETPGAVVVGDNGSPSHKHADKHEHSTRSVIPVEHNEADARASALLMGEAGRSAEPLKNLSNLAENDDQANTVEKCLKGEQTCEIIDDARDVSVLCTEVPEQKPVVATKEESRVVSPEFTIESASEFKTHAIESRREGTDTAPVDTAEETTHDHQTLSPLNPVDVVQQLTDPVSEAQLEDRDDRKISWAPGIIEPKHTVRKKKGNKTSKSKAKKKSLITAELSPHDIVGILTIVDGRDVLEPPPVTEGDLSDDSHAPIVLDDPMLTPVTPAEEAQELSAGFKTASTVGPEKPEVSHDEQSTAATSQAPCIILQIEDEPSAAKAATLSRPVKTKSAKSHKGNDKGKSKGKKTSSQVNRMPEDSCVLPDAKNVGPSHFIGDVDKASEDEVVHPEPIGEAASNGIIPDVASTEVDAKIHNEGSDDADAKEVVTLDENSAVVVKDETMVLHRAVSPDTEAPAAVPLTEEGARLSGSKPSEATVTSSNTDKLGLAEHEKHISHDASHPAAEITEPLAAKSSEVGFTGSPNEDGSTPRTDIAETEDILGKAQATSDAQRKRGEISSDNPEAEKSNVIARRDLSAVVEGIQACGDAPHVSDDTSAEEAEPVEGAMLAGELQLADTAKALEGLQDREYEELAGLIESADSPRLVNENANATAAADVEVPARSDGLLEEEEDATATDDLQLGEGADITNAQLPTDKQSDLPAAAGVGELAQSNGTLNEVDSANGSSHIMESPFSAKDQVALNVRPHTGAADLDEESQLTSRAADSEDIAASADHIGPDATTATERVSQDISKTMEIEDGSTEETAARDDASMIAVQDLELQTEVPARVVTTHNEVTAVEDALTEAVSVVQVEAALPQPMTEERDDNEISTEQPSKRSHDERVQTANIPITGQGNVQEGRFATGTAEEIQAAEKSAAQPEVETSSRSVKSRSSHTNVFSEVETSDPGSTITSLAAVPPTEMKEATEVITGDVQAKMNSPSETTTLVTRVHADAKTNLLEPSVDIVNEDIAETKEGNIEVSPTESCAATDDKQPDLVPDNDNIIPVGGGPERTTNPGETDITTRNKTGVKCDATTICPTFQAESEDRTSGEMPPPADNAKDAQTPVTIAEDPVMNQAAEPQARSEAPPCLTLSKKSSLKRHSKQSERATKRFSHPDKSARIDDAAKPSSKRSSRYTVEEPQKRHTRTPVRISMTAAESEEQAERRRRRAARKAADNAKILEEEQRQILEDEQKQAREAEERRTRREVRRAERAAAEAATKKLREEIEATALEEAESRRRRRRDSVREQDARPSTRDRKSGMFSLPRSFTGELAYKVPSFARTGTDGSHSSDSRDYWPRPTSSRPNDEAPPKVKTSTPRNDIDKGEQMSAKVTRQHTKEVTERHSHRKRHRRSVVEQPRPSHNEGDRPSSRPKEGDNLLPSRREGERRVPRKSDREESKNKPGLLKRFFG